MRGARAGAALAAGALVAGCLGGAPEAEPADAAETGAEVEATPTAVYERSFVFSSLTADSLFLVPWLMTISVAGDHAERQGRAWLARGGSWEPFYQELWSTPATRPATRLVPYAGMRIMIGDEGDVQGIAFDDASRQLELAMGDVLMEWATPWGETLRLVDSAAYISEQRVPGMVLDLSRAYAATDARPGDWAFLTSGDSLQVVLAAPPRGASGAGPPYLGWARLEVRDIRWPELVVDWAATRAFPAARRDVPVSWTISSPTGTLEGVLEVRSSEITAGDGVGPLLPVDALFEVGGTLTIESRAYPVRGLFRHRRG